MISPEFSSTPNPWQPRNADAHYRPVGSAPSLPASDVTFRDFTLLPFQVEAIKRVSHQPQDVVVAAPTGAGKTLVADWAIAEALKRNRRAYYASPVKALSNQKYRDFRNLLGEENVGLVTGDVTVNPDAPALVVTTEVFHNKVLEAPEHLKWFEVVVFDELHYLDDEQRGTVWEEAIMLTPPHMQIIALSATLPNIDNINHWMKKRRGREVVVVRCPEEDRPVPLEHRFWISPHAFTVNDIRPGGFQALELDDVPDWWFARFASQLNLGDQKRNGRIRQDSHALITYLEEHDRLPALYFCTARKDCEHFAGLHSDRNLLSEDERTRILELFDDLVDRYGVRYLDETRLLRELVANGIAFHHAGMLPSLKPVVEELFTTGLIRLLFATDTFAVGVNMPARSVCFHYLARNRGGKDMRPLLSREYSQMAGRAGRQGVGPDGESDLIGYVYSILDWHEATASNLKEYVGSNVERIESHFDPSYRSLLRMAFGLGMSIDEIWEQSFAHFELTGPDHDDSRYRSLHGRWNVLESLRYYSRGNDVPATLLNSGKLCQLLTRFEIHITEAYDRGLIRQCTPTQLVAFFTAVACRPARQNAKNTALPGTTVLDPDVQELYLERVRAIIELEAHAGVPPNRRLHVPDFRIAPAAAQWASGAPLEDVLGLIDRQLNFGAGDLVMTLRMALQCVRALYRAIDPSDECRPLLKEAAARMHRDEVDALQLVALPSY